MEVGSSQASFHSVQASHPYSQLLSSNSGNDLVVNSGGSQVLQSPLLSQKHAQLAKGKSNGFMVPTLNLACRSLKNSQFGWNHFLFREPRCPTPSAGELGVKINQGRRGSALQGWAWATAAHMALLSSYKGAASAQVSMWEPGLSYW